MGVELESNNLRGRTKTLAQHNPRVYCGTTASRNHCSTVSSATLTFRLVSMIINPVELSDFKYFTGKVFVHDSHYICVCVFSCAIICLPCCFSFCFID